MKKAEKFNVEKYIGQWHEIESFPAWFQRGCTDTIAEYTDYREEKGFLEVKNSCTRGDDRKVKVGKAFPTGQPDVLKVQFFAPFKADYRVEFVDEKYQHAVVGSGKNRDYLWILSRSPSVPEKTLAELRAVAKDKGYDVSRLVRTASK